MPTQTYNTPAYNFVAYYRVSTQKQGQSGLGLKAQQTAVTKFIGQGNLLKEFTEFESGKQNQRPELESAIEYAKQHSARLVIAKLDRLSRNAAFIFALRDSGVDFICADIPDANTLTVGIFAVMAQHEREVISERTKRALAAKKARGYKLGSPHNFTTMVQSEGRKRMVQNAKDAIANRQAISISKDKRAQGWTL